MVRYKVCRPFVDYGMYHEVDSIISDASMISNLAIRLWDGTLKKINDNGEDIPNPEIAIPPADKETPSTIATTKTKVTVIVPKVVTKDTKSTK